MLLRHIKNTGKRTVAAVLGWQVRRLHANHDFKVVAVAGGIGKTSTKMGIARVLEEQLRVRYQDGNYNDLVSVPLIYFDQSMPAILNVPAWLKIFSRNEKIIKAKDYPYDVVVLELGVDGPNQMLPFNKYVRADIAVLTSIVPEHIEQFGSLTAVAKEELQIAKFSKQLLYNKDLCAAQYMEGVAGASYALNNPADYRVANANFTPELTVTFDLEHGGKTWQHLTYHAIAKPQLYTAAAAIAVANKLGLDEGTIRHGIDALQPVAGRTTVLEGLQNSKIIDESYNSSPEATLAALDTLSNLPASKRIALLGNMNELGDMSAEAHQEVGAACDPAKLDLVVTLGKDANTHLAEAAKKRGCNIVICQSPQEAGQVIRDQLAAGTVVLVKGSQNGVFAEEAIKYFLANPEDASKLVRQSAYWIAQKHQQFGKLAGES